jgi:hypothetical protein
MPCCLPTAPSLKLQPTQQLEQEDAGRFTVFFNDCCVRQADSFTVVHFQVTDCVRYFNTTLDGELSSPEAA